MTSLYTAFAKKTSHQQYVSLIFEASL